MKGYFDFDWNFEGNQNLGRADFRFLFKPPGALKTGNLSDAIEDSLHRVLFPDVIAIICMDMEFDILVASFKNSDLLQAANRASNRTSIVVLSYDKHGEVSRLSFIRNPQGDVEDILRRYVSDYTQAGVNNIFSAPHVLIQAPPGYTFLKPSGERSVLFIKAEDALTEIEKVQFIGFSLLRKISHRESVSLQPIEVIYIDSMAIASIAYALRELYCQLFSKGSPRVVSFHSHDGFKDLDIPLPGTSFCIISASSSMRLEQRWKEKTHCLPSEVVTLLTLKSAVSSSNALCVLNASVDDEKKPTEGVDVLKDLRITGERFAPEELTPKKVLIRAPVHRVRLAEDFSKFFTGSNSLLVQSRGANAFAKVRPIFLHGDALLDSGEFKKFISDTLYQKVPASVETIVYQDDEPSLKLAKRCARKLKGIMERRKSIKIVSQNDLCKPGISIEKNKALLIVAAIVGKGSKLLSVSRDLRPLHFGARTYIVGAQIAETSNQIDMLKRNLKYSAEGSSIEVERFSYVAVGHGLSDSYKDERNVLASLPKSLISNEILSERRNKISADGQGFSHDGFLPCGKNLDRHLHLRPDFAYWTFKYQEFDTNLPAMFLTIAAILQNAREGNFKDTADRLGTEAFQQVVLDPENFSRYNDGIIQAAILRAAHPGELDYSSESAASRYMLEFLVKIITQCNTAQGEAAMEFALALSTKRLKISSEDFLILKERAKISLTGSSQLEMLLRFLLEVDNLQVPESNFPTEF